MSDEDLALLKRQIEAQLTEYQQEIERYEAWWADWCKRQNIERRAEVAS